MLIGDGPVPWFVADGTNVFWHPKAGVTPFGSGAGTSTPTQSIFADVTALAGKCKEAAQIQIEMAAIPTGSALNIRADIYQNDETTLIGSVILCNSMTPVCPGSGPVYIKSGVHAAAAGATTGGFYVKLIDIAAGASPAAATYKANVYYVLESQLGG